MLSAKCAPRCEAHRECQYEPNCQPAVKSAGHLADATLMRGSSLSIEAWLAVAMVCAWFVRLCLGVIGRHLRYEAQLHELTIAADRMQRDHARRLRALKSNIIEVDPIDDADHHHHRRAA